MNKDATEQGIILIVDDKPTNLRVLFDYLKESGFRAFVATNGERAIQQAERVQPDLILLDVMMPGIDGFEACQRLKANEATRDIPVIFMTALSDADQKVKGFDAGAVDYITKPFQQQEVLARLTTHVTLQGQKKELYDLNVTKDKFLSIIAHDVKGAFGPLLGFSDLLAAAADDFDRDQIKQISHNLHASAQNVYKLLENLLDWARIQKGAIDFQPQEVDLHQIVMDNTDLLGKNAEQKNINLSHSVEPNTQVYADLNMTDTILRNLISNALKFTNSGGSIRVDTKLIDAFVEISVCDTGIGMDEDNLSNLFKIDQKTSKLGTAGEKGTGLGLILCKEFTERNGGRIWVESKKGEGSIFHFTLPILAPWNLAS